MLVGVQEHARRLTGRHVDVKHRDAALVTRLDGHQEAVAVPRHVHEAAELDGAGPARRFWRVTLPLLLPLLSAALVVRGIATFNQFYLFWILNPNGNDNTIPTWTYSMVRFDPFLYSVSAAVNIVSVVALGVVVVWFLRWRGRAERVAFA